MSMSFPSFRWGFFTHLMKCDFVKEQPVAIRSPRFAQLLTAVMRSVIVALFLCGWHTSTVKAQENPHPNVLFIAMDDLNDWIGCMRGHPQTRTPNLDRLAARGVLFTNAHCAAPACNPSRSAIFTGRSPHRSGLYDNGQPMREVMPNEIIMPQYFRNQGYHAAGSGKLLHYFIDANSWDEYFPKAHSENPFPETYDPPNRPINLPRGGPWQYVETDWAALDVTDEEYGGDWSVSKWIGEQLGKKHEKPFFLGCGLYRPHEPWFVPKKYFEPFPLDSIQLPLVSKKMIWTMFLKLGNLRRATNTFRIFSSKDNGSKVCRDTLPQYILLTPCWVAF